MRNSIYLVFHADQMDPFCENSLSSFPSGYTQVATVTCMDLEDAFALTNHIDGVWWDNPGLTRDVQRPCRSTSVGDVIVSPVDRKAYRCDDDGWVEFDFFLN